jgi:hypothetical protein
MHSHALGVLSFEESGRLLQVVAHPVLPEHALQKDIHMTLYYTVPAR